MKVFNRVYSIIVLAFSAIFFSQILHAYAYDPWTSSTGEKVLAINPFFYTTSLNPFGLNADLIASYGITANLDVFVNFADLGLAPSFTYNFSWAMIRYDLGGNNILALQASQYLISPQYHFFWENDLFAAEVNVYANFTYTNFGSPTIGAYLAPIVKVIKDVLYFYAEVDPYYQIGGSFGLNIVPGVWLGLGNYGQISLGFSINSVTSGSLSYGINTWYFIPFDFKAKK